MKKKLFGMIISTVLVAAMMFVLAACGGNKGGDEPAPAGSGANEPASEIAQVQANGKIVIGITDFEPMDFQENGKWVGFDAELSELFAAELGVEAEFVEIDWDNKILELNSGAVDCIWNGMTLTPEVAEAMSCTDTYALNAQVVVMPADIMAEFKDADSMKDLTFAVEAGSAGESVGQEAGFTVNSVQNQAAALMEVAAGTSDACIIDKTMADAMTGEGTSYADLGYAVSLSSEEYVVGFRKGSDLTAKLNEMFTKWKQDGTMAQLSEKYGNAVSIAE
ncbi:MAG: transporter substrate-binding domain-containing protein [Lachnospiraceae bacterium]|nr:transporter substrate-binding domain-containing protein [Lachnospiraceae bacterium]